MKRTLPRPTLGKKHCVPFKKQITLCFISHTYKCSFETTISPKLFNKVVLSSEEKSRGAREKKNTRIGVLFTTTINLNVKRKQFKSLMLKSVGWARLLLRSESFYSMVALNCPGTLLRSFKAHSA